MISELGVWLIMFLPLASFLFNAFVIRPFLNRYYTVAGYTTVVAIAFGLLLSIWALGSAISSGGEIDFGSHKWVEIGHLQMTVGVILDPLTSVMLVVVTGVSLLIQIYSLEYMRNDPGYVRYYAYMSLFTASMVGLVLSSNVLQLYVFWELVGLCSYLLIGFWHDRPAAAAAAKKAFIVTRVGDFGFLLGILYLVFNFDAFAAKGLNPLEIQDIYKAMAMGGVLVGAAVTWIALGIFAGAVGKSGQFPLHIWLPDAMEGPTPVSALIHAATMVTAGVFLVARFFPLFEASQVAMNVVAVVGGVTAIFAASVGLVMFDIKRVLAYSTVSQLGYMMLALGVGAYGAAIFHLFTHAFFKALLFLGAGSINHASGTYDMRDMGGLRRTMPWTYVTFVVGSLALVGIFPLSGFWSKDEILAHVWGSGGGIDRLLFWFAMVTVFMTALYTFRMVFMTFSGTFRGSKSTHLIDHDRKNVNLHESPPIILAPLFILGSASVLVGFLVNPVIDISSIVPAHWMSDFLSSKLTNIHRQGFNFGIALGSTALAAGGIGLSYLLYGFGEPKSVGSKGNVCHALMVWTHSSITKCCRWKVFDPMYEILTHKYFFDEFYEEVFTKKIFFGWVAGTLDLLDRLVIDGAVRFIGQLGRNVGRPIAQLQTGQLQGYALIVMIGLVAILGVLFFL